MSETDETQDLSNIRRVFHDEILPLAKKMQHEGKLFFEVNVDLHRTTYYSDRVNQRIKPEDFEGIAPESAEGITEALVSLWTSEGYPELCRLAPSLSRLAKRIHSLEERPEEVSPFIYVMF